MFALLRPLFVLRVDCLELKSMQTAHNLGMYSKVIVENEC